MELKIKEVEEGFQVERVKANNVSVWPFLRYYFSLELNNIRLNKPPQKWSVYLQSIFFGWKNWFGSYQYLLFSDSAERREITGLWFDKSVDPICNVLGNSLLFELPLPKHRSRTETATKNVSSKLVIYGAVWLYTFLFLRKIKIENREILESISNQFNVRVDYVSIIKKNLGLEVIGKLLISIYKPKAVFVQCAYTQLGIVKAFRDKNIPVIEIQHGIISSHHGAYNVFKKIENHYYPDFLFSFGENEKQIFNSANYFINPQNVIPVGHFYLDYLSSRYAGNEEFKNIVSKYKTSVTVSSQDIEDEKELMEFLKEVAHRVPEILIVLFPRAKPISHYNKFNFGQNIIFAPFMNVYQSIAQTGFHATMYSTCAIEAPSLGTRNILINIHGLAKKHFDHLIDNFVTYLVNTPDEFIKCLALPDVDKLEIMSKSQGSIRLGYESNLKEALQKVLGSDFIAVR